MQASKIIPGQRYAIEHGNELREFKVTSVTTTRHESNSSRRKGIASPHDYSSEVHGYIVAYDTDVGEGMGESITLKPERIKGPFTDYKELVERKAADKAAQEALKLAKEERIAKLWRLLYAKTGKGIPNSRDENWSSPFRKAYSGVEIQGDGIEALIKLLEEGIA